MHNVVSVLHGGTHSIERYSCFDWKNHPQKRVTGFNAKLQEIIGAVFQQCVTDNVRVQKPIHSTT